MECLGRWNLMKVVKMYKLTVVRHISSKDVIYDQYDKYCYMLYMKVVNRVNLEFSWQGKYVFFLILCLYEMIVAKLIVVNISVMYQSQIIMLIHLKLIQCLSLSRVRLFATPWTVACQAPLSLIFQARVLEWVAILFSRESSQPRDCTWISCNASSFFTVWAIRKAQTYTILYANYISVKLH